MPRFDLSLYLVLDPDQSERSGGLLETARAAVAGGVTIVQLRAPRWKKRRMTEAARSLLRASRSSLTIMRTSCLLPALRACM